MKRPTSLLATVLFWLIALAQLLRVLLRVEVRAGDVNIPRLGELRGFWPLWEPGFGGSAARSGVPVLQATASRGDLTGCVVQLRTILKLKSAER